MTTEQLLSYFGAIVAICGILATVLPQQWPVTKWLTKVGALTFRAATKHPPVSGVLIALVATIALQGCSLESARYRRAAASPLDTQVRMAQSTRPVAQCQSWDSIHVWGDWSGGIAGGLAATASGVALATEDKTKTAMTTTALVLGAASTAAFVFADQSVSSWTEAGCGQ